MVAAIRASFYVAPALVAVNYEKGGQSVTIFAWSDCLYMGFTDQVRVNVSHATAQTIADMLSLTLPTSRMSDMAWQSGVQIQPQVLGAANQMASTDWMVKHSDKVSQARSRAGAPSFGGSQCVRPEGKDWVNTERLLAPNGSIVMPTHSTIGAGGGNVPAGANYGWQSTSAGLWNPPQTIRVDQSIGLAHDMLYEDYSQVMTLYANYCEIGGLTRSIEEVLSSADLAYLLSDEVQQGTACRVWRHPGVAAS